jgi:metal-sulfur cluster biosynthetic enzyme
VTAHDAGAAKETERALEAALRHCYEPEAGMNVVDLGLIYEVTVDNRAATIRLGMIAEGSRRSDWLASEVKRIAEAVAGVETARVEVVSVPRWTTSRLSSQARARLVETREE